ncbi:MAG: hypothetical protein M0Z79_07795 [Nitrospiraceae bacterium]|nr:hypothetical protein [Nitrospiraceae bacterium]
MWKNVLRLFWVSLIVAMAACAPARVVAPSHEGRDLREYLAARNGISEIETQFAIRFERNDNDMRGDAALTISKNGDMSLRVYSLGFLAMELSSKDGVTKSRPHIDRGRTDLLTRGLRDCLFWWDVDDYAVTDEGTRYVVRNAEREVWLSKKTLLPERQRIWLDDDKELIISYSEPEEKNGVWYQSKIRIELMRYAVTLSVKGMAFKS